MKNLMIVTWKCGNRFAPYDQEFLNTEHSEWWSNSYVASLYDLSTSNIERLVTRITNAERFLYCRDVRVQRVTIVELRPDEPFSYSSNFEVACWPNYDSPAKFGPGWFTPFGRRVGARLNSKVTFAAGVNRATGAVQKHVYRGCLRPQDVSKADDGTYELNVKGNFWNGSVKLFLEAMEELPEIASDYTFDLLYRYEAAPASYREWVGCGMSVQNAWAKQRDFMPPAKREFLVNLHKAASRATYCFNAGFGQIEYKKQNGTVPGMPPYGVLNPIGIPQIAAVFKPIASFARYMAQAVGGYDTSVLEPDSVAAATYPFSGTPIQMAPEFDVVTPALMELASLYDFLAATTVREPLYPNVSYSVQSLHYAQFEACRNVMRLLSFLEIVVPPRLGQTGPPPAGTKAKSPKQNPLLCGDVPGNTGIINQVPVTHINPYNPTSRWRLLTKQPEPVFIDHPLPTDWRGQPEPPRYPYNIPLFYDAPIIGPDGSGRDKPKVPVGEPLGWPPEQVTPAPEPLGGPPEQPGPGPFSRLGEPIPNPFSFYDVVRETGPKVITTLAAGGLLLGAATVGAPGTIIGLAVVGTRAAIPEVGAVAMALVRGSQAFFAANPGAAFIGLAL
jgi:hypothetical protein